MSKGFRLKKAILALWPHREALYGWAWLAFLLLFAVAFFVLVICTR